MTLSSFRRAALAAVCLAALAGSACATNTQIDQQTPHANEVVIKSGSATITGPTGQQARAASLSTTMSAEDLAAILAALQAGLSASSADIGYVQPMINAKTTSAGQSSLVVKTAAGRMFDFFVRPDATLMAAPWQLMIYDATAEAGDASGKTPAVCIPVAAGQPYVAGTLHNGGLAFPSAGMVITASTGTDCTVQVKSAHINFARAGYL